MDVIRLNRKLHHTKALGCAPCRAAQRLRKRRKHPLRPQPAKSRS
jgi:hypothetical protein